MKTNTRKYSAATILLSAALCLALFAGCAAPAAQPEAPAAPSPTEAPATRLEHAQPEAPQANPQPGSNAGNVTAPAASPANATVAADAIGLDAAKKIALEHAKLSEADVTFTKAKEDRDDGRLEYDLEFLSGSTEYEYEIDANTGSILQASTEAIQPSKLDESGYIGIEAAKEKALAHAGFTAGEVTFTKAKLDYDDGRAEYDIEFVIHGEEHEFEIDATDGRVLEYDIEKQHD